MPKLELGVHRTIIKSAVPLIEMVMQLPGVWRVDVGRIDRTGKRDTVGVHIHAQQVRITLTVTDTQRKQVFLICTRSLDMAASVFSALWSMVSTV